MRRPTHGQFTEEQQQSGVVEYNFRAMDTRTELGDADTLAVYGTDLATAFREAPGMSAFALEDGVVYHTYSAYTRGLDGLWGMYQWCVDMVTCELVWGTAATTSTTASDASGSAKTSTEGKRSRWNHEVLRCRQW
jgi:hypothetical protein